MNLTKLYTKLDSEERYLWFDAFRSYFLSNKDKYSELNNLHSSDVQTMFTNYIRMQTEHTGNPQSLGRIIRSAQMGRISDITNKFLEYQYNKRLPILVEKYPEVLI